MKKTLSIFTLTLLFMILSAVVASAHVTVHPNETSQGRYEIFTVRVPSEIEGTPTVQVEVRIPEDVNITRVEPKPDWTYSLERDDSDKISTITWTTTGEGLSITEFTEFKIQGRVGDQAESLVWRAYQSYGDGTVVEWIGAEGSDKPASTTTVKAAAGADAHGGAAEENGVSQLPLYLGIIAVILSLAALIVAIAKKKSVS